MGKDVTAWSMTHKTEFSSPDCKGKSGRNE